MLLETPLLDLHRASHAQVAEYFGTILPARFGDFSVEYTAARKAVALVDTNYRAEFIFSGADRQRYLNAMLTSNVRDLKPEQGTVGLLLNPQGHTLVEVETLALADRVLAFSHAMVRERTFATFDKFIIMDDVVLEDVTSSTGTLDLLGPGAAELISKLAGVDIAAMPASAHVEADLRLANSGSIPCRIVRHTWLDHPAAMLVVAREQLSELWQQLECSVRAHGGAPTGFEAINAIRLEQGIAWFGQDYDDKRIPHETGLETSHINYVKGCYTGQEIVERVRSRGHANWRLTALQFHVDDPPASGTKLFASGKEAGYVTSAARSPLLGTPIGLGYVRREHTNIGTRFDAPDTSLDANAEVIQTPVTQTPVTESKVLP